MLATVSLLRRPLIPKGKFICWNTEDLKIREARKTPRYAPTSTYKYRGQTGVPNCLGNMDETCLLTPTSPTFFQVHNLSLFDMVLFWSYPVKKRTLFIFVLLSSALASIGVIFMYA